MQAYSDPKRENDPHALPDVEVFHVGPSTPADECPGCQAEADDNGPADDQDEHDDSHAGYYWQACFPGCLPDSDPVGPFPTEAEALADAQQDASDGGDADPSDTPHAADCDGCCDEYADGHGCNVAR